ncbi:MULTISPECIES: DUF3618 domain-containing protein [Mycetocola]|uniref:DUF3618 domain-containing protein n=1 Tax=Mycetocola lacteus TaxID=76637 RepID=A0A3L7AEI6_9MICO|nr:MULTISPECIES: DUF3618 domain-containing protein [Mycetocola]MCS4277998.1 hypothetical protein [Mycetocola sp. BIGb0189]RLP78823.1 DUF3618 domain-containing protein [Mycetocola lacteus]
MTVDKTPEEARAELVATLNALEDKLNVPKRVGGAVNRGKKKLKEFSTENPGGALGVAAAATVTVGLAAWGIVRALSRR